MKLMFVSFAMVSLPDGKLTSRKVTLKFGLAYIPTGKQNACIRF